MNRNEALQILLINKYTNMDNIKKKFRLLAIRYHPDKGGDKQKFIKINKAYQYIVKINQYKKLDHDLESDFLDSL